MVPKDVRERHTKLKTAINKYRMAYHVHDREEVPESARDSLMQELTKLERQYPELVTPASPKTGKAPGRESV